MTPQRHIKNCYNIIHTKMNSFAFCVLISVVMSPLCIGYTRSIRKAFVVNAPPKLFPSIVSPTAITVHATSATSTSTRSKMWSRFGNDHENYFTRLFMSQSGSPTAPMIKKLDEHENLAIIEVVLSAQQTQKAFDTACEMFNDEVKTRGYKVIQNL